MTTYTDQALLDRIKRDDIETISAYMDYVMWECSTEFWARYGFLTNEDVSVWIQCLKEREDANSPHTQQLIRTCEQYITD